MSAARYGEPFATVQVGEIELGEEVCVGLFVCSHAENEIETAMFQDVRIVQPVKADFVRERNPFGSQLEILDIPSHHRKLIYSAEHVFEAPNWTRDDKALVFNREGRLYHFGRATGKPISSYLFLITSCSFPASSPIHPITLASLLLHQPDW
jgi:hypothetical protein